MRLSRGSIHALLNISKSLLHFTTNNNILLRFNKALLKLVDALHSHVIVFRKAVMHIRQDQIRVPVFLTSTTMKVASVIFFDLNFCEFFVFYGLIGFKNIFAPSIKFYRKQFYCGLTIC